MYIAFTMGKHTISFMIKKVKILCLTLVLALALSCAFSLASCNILGDYGEVYLDKVDLTVELKENGDVEVTERWDVTVDDDDVRNLYRTVNLYDANTKVSSNVKDFYVVDNDNNKRLTETGLTTDPSSSSSYDKYSHQNRYYVYPRSSTEVELGFFIPVMNEESRSYTLHYTLTNVVSVYDDCAVLYYMPYSTDFELAIKEFTGKVILPKNAQISEDTKAYFHTEISDSTYEVKADEIVFGANKFYNGDSLEYRIVMDSELFSSSTKVISGAKRQSVIDEENAWYEEYQQKLHREETWTIVFTVIGGLLVLLGVFSIYYFKKIYPKVKGEYPPYVRAIPETEGSRAAEMAHFFYHYEFGTNKKKNRGNMISATVLDLTRRGYLALAPDPDNPDDYTIEVIFVEKYMRRVLANWEESIYNLLRDVSVYYEGRPFTMKEFQKYARANAVRVNDAINYFLRESGAFKLKKHYEINKGITPNRVNSLAVFSLIAGLFIFLSAPLATYLGAGLFIFAILLIVGRPHAKKLNLDGEAKYMESKGLEAFMLDFSNLKEHEIPALILWEEYMVYATMMGISERVLAELKLKYPELREPTPVDVRSYYRSRSYLYCYVALNNTGADLGTKMNGAFNTVAISTQNIIRAANAKNTAGKIGGSIGRSGGGFSGGGGGFGGGGGGAR